MWVSPVSLLAGQWQSYGCWDKTEFTVNFPPHRKPKNPKQHAAHSITWSCGQVQRTLNGAQMINGNRQASRRHWTCFMPFLYPCISQCLGSILGSNRHLKRWLSKCKKSSTTRLALPSIDEAVNKPGLYCTSIRADWSHYLSMLSLIKP